MRCMNFNSTLIELLSKIMKSAHSRALINGNLSEQILVERSVRKRARRPIKYASLCSLFTPTAGKTKRNLQRFSGNGNGLCG